MPHSAIQCSDDIECRSISVLAHYGGQRVEITLTIDGKPCTFYVEQSLLSLVPGTLSFFKVFFMSNKLQNKVGG